MFILHLVVDVTTSMAFARIRIAKSYQLLDYIWPSSGVMPTPIWLYIGSFSLYMYITGRLTQKAWL